MKLSKKILSVLLAVIIAVGVLTPSVFAEESVETAINWDELYIVSHPVAEEGLTYGDDIKLQVEVNVPDGVDVTYVWSRGNTVCEGFNEPSIVITKDSEYYPEDESLMGVGTQEVYYCKIIAEFKNENGEVIESRTKHAKYVTVEMESTLAGKLGSVFIAPFYQAFQEAFMYAGVTFGLLLPLFPVIFIINIPVYFVNNIVTLSKG